MSLSSDILQSPFVLKEIISLTTWEQLSLDQRSHLINFLPDALNEDQKNDTIRRLFDGDNLAGFSSSLHCSSGNPVDELISKLESGFYSQDACLLRKYQRKALKAKAKYERSRYYHNLLKEIIVSRQCHLSAITFPQCFKLVQEKRAIKSIDNETQAKIQKSAENMYYRILNEVKQEVLQSPCLEEDVISSDSDSDAQPNSSNRLLLNTVSNNRIKAMMIHHHDCRTAQLKSPDLDVNGIKLHEVCGRAYGVAKRNSAGILRKRKRIEGAIYSKQKKMKSSSGEKEPKKRFHGLKERGSITSPSCYFQLIRDVIQLTSDKTINSIQLLISDWLASAEASRYDWTSSLANWKELVRSALEFLSAKTVPTNAVSPLLHHDEGSWKWNSMLEDDEEKIILQDLCSEWLDQIAELLVESTSNHGVNSFHSQERRRYMYAHQAFVYNINGTRYPVPPVKGTAGPVKEGKVAREHCLLKSERPPQVTLLALTRDAVARLPQGRGTRSLVCSLVKDSQYLAPLVTEAQINAAVSGALDRLHYEVDPCVKYDASAKVWMYLHGERSPEELERIHSEQLGAPKKKRDRGMRKSKLKHSESRKKTKEINQKSKEAKQKPNTSFVSEDGPSRGVSDTKAAPQLFNDQSSSGNSSCLWIGSSSHKPIATRTIQVTQKQLLEMTQKLTDAGSISGSKEVLLTPVEKKPPSSPVNLSSAKLNQPGLKLILKSGASELNKSTAELVKVVDTPPIRNLGNQPLLSPDALRRLTEQLSAMSSRPIKIVQRNIAPPHNSSGSRVINITSRPSFKNSSNSSASLSTSGSGSQTAKTVYISRVGGEDVTEKRVVHIAQKPRTDHLNVQHSITAVTQHPISPTQHPDTFSSLHPAEPDNDVM